MSPSPEALSQPADAAVSFDPPEAPDDTPIAPFDRRNEEHDLCLCQEDHDA